MTDSMLNIAGGIIIAALLLGCGLVGLQFIIEPEDGISPSKRIGLAITVPITAIMMWIVFFR